MAGARFDADADRRGTRVPEGEPAPVGATSPRCGEKAGYCSAVGRETGEVEVMERDAPVYAVPTLASA